MADPIPLPENSEPSTPHRTVLAKGKVWQSSGKSSERSGRRTALVVGLFLFVSLLAAVVAMVLVLSPEIQPYFESVPITKYDDPDLPPNPWAEQDSRFLCAAFPDDTSNYSLSTQERLKIRDLLDKRREGKLECRDGTLAGPEQPYVLHVVGLAAVEAGEVYLLPADALASDRSNWIKIDDLLTAMRESKFQRKLLVLDIARSTANPILGPLSDDVATQLDQMLEDPKREALPCPVLTSCSPGEVSHMIPSVRVSAFAFYLSEGLRGHANGYGPSGNHANEKITVRELAGYLAVRTARWVKTVLDQSQSPKLYTRGLTEKEIDFPIVLDARPGEEPETRPLSVPATTLALWKERDQTPLEVRRFRAAAWNRWESTVLRAEAGLASLADTDLSPRAGSMFQEAGKRPLAVSAGQKSLPPLPVVEAGKPDPLKSLRESFQKLWRAGLAESLLVEPAKANFEKARAEFEIASGENPTAAARLIWEWMLNEYSADVPSRMLKLAEITLDSSLRSRVSDYHETAALKSLVTSPGGAFDSPEAARARALYLAAVQESASIAAMGPTAFEWVLPRALAAEKSHAQAAETLLQATEQAQFRLAIDQFKDIPDQYREVRNRLKIAAEARTALHEAIRVTTATALPAAEWDYPPAETLWNDLARASTVLADRVSIPARNFEDWNPAELEVQVSAVRDSTNRVGSLFQGDRVKEVLGQSKASTLRPADLPRLRAMLACPLISAEDRKELWTAFDVTMMRLHNSVREEFDLPETESGQPGRPPTRGRIVPVSPSRRAAVSIALLGLAGVVDTAGSADLTRILAADGPDRLKPKLHKSWREDYPREILAAAKSNDWPRVDRLSRTFPVGIWPLDRKSAPDDPSGWRDAAPKRWDRDERAFQEWLALTDRKSSTPRTGGAAARP